MTDAELESTENENADATGAPEGEAAEPEAPASPAAISIQPSGDLPPVGYGSLQQPGAANPSPDGTTLAYLHDEMGDGTLRLTMTSLIDGTSRTVAEGLQFVADDQGPQWSPSGATLAVGAISPKSGNRAIALVTVETGEFIFLIDHAAHDRSPRWSPNGEVVAFVTSRGGQESIAIALSDGFGPATQVTLPPEGSRDHAPIWAPDGTRIGFLRRTAEQGETASGDHVNVVNLSTGDVKQATKKLIPRSQIQFGSSRPLVMHVAHDGEWDSVAVVNVDNQAAWSFASEIGDKSDPHFNFESQRLVYLRGQNGVVRVCERATSSATANLCDPGDGVGSSPRYLPDRQIVYAFASATSGWRFIVQLPTIDAARYEVALPGTLAEAPGPAVVPTELKFETADGLKLSGQLFMIPEGSGPRPGVVVIGDNAGTLSDQRPRPIEQALAAAGFVVFAPVISGMKGFGRKSANALKASADTEAEVNDVIDAIRTLMTVEGVNADQIAVVGDGWGGAIALLLAGGRPGFSSATVAIDPIADWSTEIDMSSDQFRAWALQNLGLPGLQHGRYALRTPSTFAGAIRTPLMLVKRENAPAHRALQIGELATLLEDSGVPFEGVEASASAFELGQSIVAFLSNLYRAEPVAADGGAAADAPTSEELASSDATDAAPDAQAELAEAVAERTDGI